MLRSVLSVALFQAIARSGFANGLASVESYVSRPDLHPLSWIITQEPSGDYQDGIYFACPIGTSVLQTSAVAYTSAGDVVWVSTDTAPCMDFRTQMLNGVEVLTVWNGTINTAGWGSGHSLILDETYSVTKTLTTTTELGSDIHEFTIPAVTGNTALLSAYVPTPANLTSVGGSSDGYVLEPYFQEVDAATNEVLFTWNARPHVSFADSYTTPASTTSESSPWDYFHLNSVDKDTEGNYLVSSRHYHSLYYISGETGEVLWTLGGKNTTWTMGSNTQFSWQHDARWVDPSTRTAVTMFDDASNGSEDDEPNARGLRLDLDYDSMTASFSQEYLPLDLITSTSQGSNRILSDGNVLVGWGSNPWFSEYTVGGTMIYSAAIGGAKLTGGKVQNYRAFKSTTWKGYPQALPDVSILGLDVFVSWNGATEVASWEVLVGTKKTSLSSSTKAAKTGFETKIALKKLPAYFQVKAYDADGNVLGTSSIRSSLGAVVGAGSVSPPPKKRAYSRFWGAL